MRKVTSFTSILLLILIILQFVACTPSTPSPVGSWQPCKVEHNDTHYTIEDWNNNFIEIITISSIDIYSNGDAKVFSAIHNFTQIHVSNCSWTKSGNKITVTGEGFTWIELYQSGDFLTQTLNMNDKSITLYYQKSQ